MEEKQLERFKKTNLRNISSNMYGFLKNNYGKRININNQFDFDDYKESIRYDLVNFCSDYLTLGNSNNEKLRNIAYEKRVLVSYIDEILENEELLDSFTIYKIQQFINRVARKMLENNENSFVTVSKKEKYLEYKDIEIDATPVIGFVTADKIISYLYREFSLKRVNSSEYESALLKSIKPDYSILFKAAVDINEKKQIVIDHPSKDDSDIFNFICDKCVADKTPKRVLKKVLSDDYVEDILTQ